MTDIQPRTIQTVVVRVPRTPGLKLAPEDFARRMLAKYSGLCMDARLSPEGTGVEFVEGLQGDEDELANGLLLAILRARFQISLMRPGAETGVKVSVPCIAYI